MMNMFKALIEKLYLNQSGNLVYYDSMTGCKTRLYYDRVAKDKYSLGNYGVCYVDIDNLKAINDKKGHLEGDKLIKDISNKLLHLEGVLDVCRIGGDEFVLFTNIPFDLNQVYKIKHVSSGFDFTDVCQSLETTISNAEKAMYREKELKRKNGKARNN